MLTSPLVSIIIPTYNRAHLIGETLDSVLAQTYTNWECIIVDDGSSDHTDEVVGKYLKKDPRFKYYHRPDTHLPGGNGARNYGFLQSKGAYVNWFDSDDIMLEGFIEQKMKHFKNDIHFLICTGYYWDDKTDEKELIEINDLGSLYKNYVFFKARVFTPSVLFKRGVLNKSGLFSEVIIRCQETDFFSRFFYENSDIQYSILKVPLFLYRQHNDRKTTSDEVYHFKSKEDILQLHVKNFGRAIELRDFEMIVYCYKKIIKMLFSALRHHHTKNVNEALKGLKDTLFQKNKWLYFKLWIFVKMFRLKSKRVENHFKYHHLNIVDAANT